MQLVGDFLLPTRAKDLVVFVHDLSVLGQNALASELQLEVIPAATHLFEAHLSEPMQWGAQCLTCALKPQGC